MFKKTSDALKKCIVFFIDFSSIFREKSTKNRAKSLNNGIAHKNRQKSGLGTPFFSKKSIFGRFLGILRVPGGLPGRPGSLPESFVFSTILNFVRKRARTVPREAPGRPRGSPQAPSGYHFGSIFARFCMPKNVEKISKNITETWQKLFQNLESNLTLIRATVDDLMYICIYT